MQVHKTLKKVHFKLFISKKAGHFIYSGASRNMHAFVSNRLLIRQFTKRLSVISGQ